MLQYLGRNWSIQCCTSYVNSALWKHFRCILNVSVWCIALPGHIHWCLTATMYSLYLNAVLILRKANISATVPAQVLQELILQVKKFQLHSPSQGCLCQDYVGQGLNELINMQWEGRCTFSIISTSSEKSVFPCTESCHRVLCKCLEKYCDHRVLFVNSYFFPYCRKRRGPMPLCSMFVSWKCNSTTHLEVCKSRVCVAWSWEVWWVG